MQTDVTHADEIRLQARTYQYDRYVSALLLPRRHREALIVLAAFAGELQRIPLITSEPMIAAVRLQWWRDALMTAATAQYTKPSSKVEASDGAATEPVRTGHLLLDALVEVAMTRKLPFGLLQGMIDAAEIELDPAPFAETVETQQVLVKFEGALFELAGKVLGSQDLTREMCADAAIAYGATRLAAQAPARHWAGAQTYVSREAIAAAPDGEKDPQTILVAMAMAPWERLCRAYSKLERPASGALLPLATVRPLVRILAMSARQSGVKDVELDSGLSDFARARWILWSHWRAAI